MSLLRTLTLLVVVAAAHVAHAGDPDPKEINRRATAHYNLGRFKEAAQEYEQVYELHQDPVIFYNIAQAYRLAGEDEKALFFYKRFLTQVPEAKNRTEVEGRVSALEKSIAEKKAAAAKPAARPDESKPAVVVAAAKPAPQPVYKKWWLWTIVGVVIVGAGVGAGVGLTVGAKAPAFKPNLPEGGNGAQMALRF